MVATKLHVSAAGGAGLRSRSSSTSGSGRRDASPVVVAMEADAARGKGPGTYRLEGITHLYVDRSGPMATLYANADRVGYLTSSVAKVALAARDTLRKQGKRPARIVLQGHYADTVFYVDRIEIAAPGGWRYWLSLMF